MYSSSFVTRSHLSYSQYIMLFLVKVDLHLNNRIMYSRSINIHKIAATFYDTLHTRYS